MDGFYSTSKLFFILLIGIPVSLIMIYLICTTAAKAILNVIYDYKIKYLKALPDILRDISIKPKEGG